MGGRGGGEEESFQTGGPGVTSEKQSSIMGTKTTPPSSSLLFHHISHSLPLINTDWVPGSGELLQSRFSVYLCVNDITHLHFLQREVIIQPIQAVCAGASSSCSILVCVTVVVALNHYGALKWFQNHLSKSKRSGYLQNSPLTKNSNDYSTAVNLTFSTEACPGRSSVLSLLTTCIHIAEPRCLLSSYANVTLLHGAKAPTADSRSCSFYVMAF